MKDDEGWNLIIEDDGSVRRPLSDRIVRGVLSAEGIDLQGDNVHQKALNMEKISKYAIMSFNHGVDEYGEPDFIPMGRMHKWRYVGKRIEHESSVYPEEFSPLINKCWDKMKEWGLDKLGFSIGGRSLEKTCRGGVCDITKADIVEYAVTPRPAMPRAKATHMAMVKGDDDGMYLQLDMDDSIFKLLPKEARLIKMEKKCGPKEKKEDEDKAELKDPEEVDKGGLIQPLEEREEYRRIAEMPVSKSTLINAIKFFEQLLGRPLMAGEVDNMIRELGMVKSVEAHISKGGYKTAQEAIAACSECADYYTDIIQSGTAPDKALLKFQTLIDGVVKTMGDDDKDKDKDKAPPSEEEDKEAKAEGGTPAPAPSSEDPHEEDLMPGGKSAKSLVDALEKKMNERFTKVETSVVAIEGSLSKIEKALVKTEKPPAVTKDITTEEAIEKLVKEGYSFGGTAVPTGTGPQDMADTISHIKKSKEEGDERLMKGAKDGLVMFGDNTKEE